MVVGLVLEQQQPRLGLAVDVDLDLHRAGIDLLGLVEVRHLARGAQRLRPDRAHVHEGDGLRPAEFLSDAEVVAVRLGYRRILELDVAEHRGERGVAAMIRPVGVDHAQFGDRRITLLGTEVITAEREIGGVHRQPVLGDRVGKLAVVELGEAGEHSNIGWLAQVWLQRRRNIQACQARFDGVHEVVLDRGELVVGEFPGECVDLRGADRRAVDLEQDLCTLGGRIGPLVELARQRLHREHRPAVLETGGSQIRKRPIHRRLGEERSHRLVELRIRQPCDVVALQHAHRLDTVDAEAVADLAEQLGGLERFSITLLDVNPSHHGHASSSRTFAPMSRRW